MIILYDQAKPRMTLFTGSSRVADKLAVDLKGRVKLEDAGFDWKILGPDVQEVITCTVYACKIFAIYVNCKHFWKLHCLFYLFPCRRIMLRGFVIKMHMHAVGKSALHNRCYSCMR